jgi:hypothetical protein
MPGLTTGAESVPSGDIGEGDGAAGPDPPAGATPAAPLAPPPRPEGAPDRPAGPGLRFPAGLYLGVASVLMATVWFSANHLRRNPGYPVQHPVAFLGDFLVEGWMRWDGGWYATISHTGYSFTPGAMSSVAFFPAYPLAMRLVQLVVPDPGHVLPGIIVTCVCGLAATVVLHHWCRVVGIGAAVARTTMLLLLLYPYAWYLYGAVYADALFLVCTVGAFVLLERDRPVLAGLLAVVATAARPVGLGVALGLVAVTLERRGAVTVPFLDRVRAVGWRGAWGEVRSGERAAGVLRVARGRLRVRDAGVLLSVGGLGAWMWYLRSTFGDPLLFIHAESAPGWDQQPGPRTWLKISWLANLKRLPLFAVEHDVYWDKLIYTLGITFQAVLVLGALCLVPAVIRRLGWGYAAYLVGVLGIPLLGSKDWQGTGRYLLAAFPVFVVAAGWLTERRPALRWAVHGVSAAALVFLTSAFARGFYLA